MSAPIELVEGGKGVLAFYPIYRNQETKKEILGFFIAVIKIQELIQEALKDEFFNKGIASISVKDTQMPQNEGLIFSYECSSVMSNLYYESKIDFGSRSWSVQAYASNYFMDVQSTKYPFILLMLLFGVSFLGAFATFMMLKKQDTLMEANEEMRRFANVAITREERISELKKIIKDHKRS